MTAASPEHRPSARYMRTTAFANAAILMGVAAAQLRLPVSRQPAHASPLHRRTPTADLTGDSLRYSVNVSVGTPSQELSLFLSFDSEKTWVPHPTSCGEFDDCPGGSCELGLALKQPQGVQT